MNSPITTTTTTVLIHIMARTTQLRKEKRESIIRHEETPRHEGQSIRLDYSNSNVVVIECKIMWINGQHTQPLCAAVLLKDSS